MSIEDAQMMQDEDDDLPPTEKDRIIICEQIKQLIAGSGLADSSKGGDESKKVGPIRLCSVSGSVTNLSISRRARGNPLFFQVLVRMTSWTVSLYAGSWRR